MFTYTFFSSSYFLTYVHTCASKCFCVYVVVGLSYMGVNSKIIRSESIYRVSKNWLNITSSNRIGLGDVMQGIVMQKIPEFRCTISIFHSQGIYLVIPMPSFILSIIFNENIFSISLLRRRHIKAVRGTESTLDGYK